MGWYWKPAKLDSATPITTKGLREAPGLLEFGRFLLSPPYGPRMVFSRQM